MQSRFQIEDLIDQNESGVVFRAIDTETGRVVALRRFFPFGPSGGGLSEDEQVAYQVAIGRLSAIQHPALRAIIGGGCDPVDGIPYIVTEWIDGHTLGDLLQQGPLPVEHATELISEALEVSELLSRVLAEEAVWVETNNESVIVGNDSSGRRFTFWIAPLKWLGGGEDGPLLAPVIALTEQVMHWKGRVVSDQAGRGLGGWLKWMRGAAATSTLHEARENLAAAVGREPPPSAQALVAKASQPQPKIAHSSSRGMWWTIGLLACAVGGLALWMTQRERPNLATTISEADPELIREARAAETASPPPAAEKPAAPPPSLAQQKAALERQGGVFSPEQGKLLAQQKAAELEGVLERFDRSDRGKGKTLYLIFRGASDKNSPRGRILPARGTTGLTEQTLDHLIGKQIRIRGTVYVQRSFGLNRPEITITSPDGIKPVQ